MNLLISYVPLKKRDDKNFFIGENMSEWTRAKLQWFEPQTPLDVESEVSECWVKDGNVSVWKRIEGQLTYSLAGMHKLVPPPSRITNNATVSLLCVAASPWQRCLADAPHDTVLRSPAPSRRGAPAVDLNPKAPILCLLLLKRHAPDLVFPTSSCACNASDVDALLL